MSAHSQGMCHIFIHNFSRHANPLIKLTCKGTLFEFRPEQIAVQEDLKTALMGSPVLCPIDTPLTPPSSSLLTHCK